MGKEQVRAAHRAVRGSVDSRGSEPGGQKLRTGGGHQIEMLPGTFAAVAGRRLGVKEQRLAKVGAIRLRAGRRTVKEAVGFPKLAAERVHHFVTHFVTARTDARSEHSD